MSDFFNYLPKIDYDINKMPDKKIQATDIFKRFRVIEAVQKRTVIYYNYYCKDGDRPDIIADKYYDDPNLDWIILIFNKTYDPYFNWFMTEDEFKRYIDKTYGSISNAVNTNHGYYKVINEDIVNTDGTIVPKRKYRVDYNTYLTLTADEREAISKFTYERTKNEENRTIKILDKYYLPQIIDEVERIFD